MPLMATPAQRGDTDRRKVRLLLLCDEVHEGRPELRRANVEAADLRHALAFRASDGRTQSHKDLTDAEVEKVIGLLEDVKRGVVDFARVAMTTEGWVVQLVRL